MSRHRFVLRLAALAPAVLVAACAGGVEVAPPAAAPPSRTAHERPSADGADRREARVPDANPRGAKTRRDARKDESPDGDRPFPREDARTALAAAKHGLRSCRAPGGPGEIDATVRFAPTGRVSDVDVVPADGAVTACIRAKLAQIEVVPFDGEPVALRTRVRM